jgi:bifunctional non-homologous end joining protein LigD
MILIKTKLTEYKRKRKFNSTPEPSGITSGRKNNIKRFVIHKHSASRLHYDLRLEAEGVLKSWAVPKGPSLNPEDKRLAMMVEDHPFDYRNFEGIIPKGNYGAGQVIIWDEGNYILRNPDKKFNTSLKEGRITFVLNGHKLKGEFALIKTKKEDSSWLLIKKRDEFSKEKDITKENKSVRSGLSIEQVENNKERKKGQKTKMPENLKPMLATLTDAPFDRNGWFFEIKWDGFRAIAEIKNKKVRLYSRNNLDFNERFPQIAEELKKIDENVILDGEIVALDKDGRARFQLMQNYLNNNGGVIAYYVFDIIYLDGYDLKNLPLRERRSILQKTIPKLQKISLSDYIENSGKTFYKAAEERDVEGIIAKNSESFYTEGRRSTEWLKIKTSKRQEAVIGGFTKPRGSRKFFGSLILGVFENNKLIYIGHSGGGFDYETQKKLYEKFKKLITDSSPFNVIPKTNMPATWLKPELVCEIKFTEWTDDGRMRQPIFLGLRYDKNPKKIIKEMPEPKELIMNKELNNKKEKTDNVEVPLTNLDKIYWPKEKFTKGDMIDYYKRISKFILPYLKDRPESLNRHPNGIKGEGFFQKNFEKHPEWVKTVSIYSESNEKEINYLVCQNKATLLYMANLGAIEINPWSSRIKDLDNPDYCILDLDPLGIGFEKVIEVALATNELLEKSGITSFCKTSGASGLHIMIPLGAKYSFDQSKTFAQLIANIIQSKLPKITSIKRDPDQRNRKVYIDFLQNRKGQTITAPYSLRPKEGVPVSTPLKWIELKSNLKPEQFNARNIFDRLDRVGDIFKPILGKGIDMEKALKNLEKTDLSDVAD